MLTLIQIELLKINKLRQVWLLLVFSFVVTIFMFVYTHQKESFCDFVCIFTGDKNPWNFYLIRSGYLLVQAIFFTLLLAALIATIATAEHQARSWKTLLIIPYKVFDIFLSKFIVIWSYFSLLYFLNTFLYAYLGFFMSYLRPELKLSENIASFDIYFLFSLKLYICLLPILVIHFWFSILFKNILVVSILLPITFLNIPLSQFNPYILTYRVLFEYLEKADLAKQRGLRISDFNIIGLNELVAFVWIVVVSITAYYAFNKITKYQ